MTMKKIFMSMAVVAAMFAAVSCACNNNKAAEECAATECTECTECEGCEKECEKACEKECFDSAKCAQCDSTCVDCNKAE